MRRTFAIAWKDLRSVYRQPSALALMIGAPLLLALLLGLAFGGQGGFQLQPVKTAIANLDDGAAVPLRSPSAITVNLLTASGLRDLIDPQLVATATAARRLVDDGNADVAVIIPKGFDAGFTGGGSRRSVTIYKDPVADIGAGVLKGIVDQVVADFDNAERAARAAAGVLTAEAESLGPAVEDLARAAAERAALSYATGAAAQGQRVSLEERAPRFRGGVAGKDPGVTGQVLAGMMVFFLFFGAANAARTILVEQQAGTLTRLFTTPSRRSEVLGGKLLVSFLTVVVQALVLMLAGWLLFRIHWGGIDAVAALTFAGCAAASGLAMLIAAFSRTLAQEGAIGAGIFLVLALIGGNFAGGATLEGTAKVLRRLTPNGWLLEGWDAAMRGGGLGDIGLQLLVPLAFAAAFFSVALFVLKRRFA